MAEQTTNLGLTKPDAAEGYDINVFNGNADKMDEFAGEVRQMLGGTGGGLGDKVDALQQSMTAARSEIAAVKTDTEALVQALATANQNIATLLMQTKGVKSVHNLYATGQSNDGTFNVNLPAGVNKDRIVIIIAPRTPAAYTINADGTIKFIATSTTPQVYYTIIEFY